MRKLSVMILAATCLLYTPAEAKSPKSQTAIDYTLEFVEGVQVVGMNRHGEIAAIAGQRGAFIDNRDKTVEFECPQFDRPDERYTYPTAINNDGTIVGSCASGTFGFVRRKDGQLYQFSIPGADGVQPFGMNDREEIVGEYYTPFPAPNVSGWYRFKSFHRKPDGQVTVIAAPPHPDDLGAPYSLTRTVAYAVNRRGEIVGTYETIFTPSNEPGMWSSFLYSNGQFTDLPRETWPISINNDSQILMRTMTGFALYDDGHLYTINAPAGFIWVWIDSMNDLGQLTGQVAEGVWPNVRFREVIATPKGGN
jgi:hypothetical protein